MRFRISVLSLNVNIKKNYDFSYKMMGVVALSMTDKFEIDEKSQLADFPKANDELWADFLLSVCRHAHF